MLVMGDEDPRALLTDAHGDAAGEAWGAAVGRCTRPGREYPAGYWVPGPHATPHAAGRRAGVYAVVESGPDAGLTALVPRGDSMLGRERVNAADGARITLRSPRVARRHARISVTSEGVVITPLGGPVRLGARPLPGATSVDERMLLSVGDDAIRLLPARPAPPARPGGNPAELGPGPAAPRTPWIALLAAVAPLGVGAALWGATGSWFMLLFGCLGLVTAGPLAAVDLATRRRLRRAARARALRTAAEATAGFPAPGTFLAAWGAAPRTGAPGTDEATPPHHGSRFPARLGPMLRPTVRVAAPEPSRRGARHAVPALPALIHPLPGERVGVRGGHRDSDGLLRIVAAWWIAGMRETDTLELARDPAWPAGLLGIPGVRLGDVRAPVIARMSWDEPRPGGAVRRSIELARLGPREGASWLIDPGHARLVHDHRSTAFSAQGCGFEGLDDAARRLARSAVALAPSPSASPPAPRGATPGAARRGLSAIVGEGEHGPVNLDLLRDGPHALVAGTTGAGKSDFLRGWFAGLAENYPPERLRFVLFDFKGGSTFGPFARLPHTDAVVTDLGAEASERVLDALAVEVKRREAWLASRGATGLEEAAGLPGCPAHVVVAVDEFRVLADEVPQVLQRLVRIATVGRSLGLHLVLATQRPQGVISAEIRANVALTVVLRLASEHESIDVLGSPCAASIDPAKPGSAYVRVGGGTPAPVRFLPAEAGHEARSDELIGPRLCDARTLAPAPVCLRTFDERLAAAAEGRVRPAPPLVPAPLPDAPVRLSVARAGQGLLLGLRHHPDGAATAFRWDPSEGAGLALIAGSTAELGAVGSAVLSAALAHRSVAERSIVFNGLGPRLLLDRLHAPLALAAAEDPAWADEVLAEAAERTADPGQLIVWVLGLGPWLADGSASAGMLRESRLLELVQRPGVAPVLAGTRELAGSRWLLPCPHRIYLPRGAGEESTVLWPRLTPTSAAPGRGALLGPGLPERGAPVQLLVAGEAAHGAAQPARPLWAPPPSRVPGGSLALPAIALASVTGAPLAWRPRGRVGLIVGGPGSGRSTAIRLLCAAWGEPWARWLPGTEPPQPDTWAVVDDADTWPREHAYELAERVRSGARTLVTALASPRLHLSLPWCGELDPTLDVVLLGPRSPAEAQACGWTVAADVEAPPGRCWLVPSGRSRPLRAQLAVPQDP